MTSQAMDQTAAAGEASRAPYTLDWARRYFNVFGPALSLLNRLDRRAYRTLVERSEIQRARSVVELGAGNGQLADLVLEHSRARRVTLLEVSDYSLKRLRSKFGDDAARVAIHAVTAPPPLPLPAGGFDRFLTCFVLEQMDPATRSTYIEEAHRLLAPGGLFCCMSVIPGSRVTDRMFGLAARTISAVTPWFGLGLKTCNVRETLGTSDWSVQHHRLMPSAGLTTQILVAERL